jgi:DNA-binding LytR/AlgR family response regulator
MNRIEKIAIVSHGEILYLNTYDIVYCESLNDGIKIYFIDGSITLISKQLSKVQSLLPAFFVRVTQCVIINKLYLVSIDKKAKLIKMEGQFSIPYTLALNKLVERIGRISTAEMGKVARFSDDVDGAGALLEIA